MKILGTRGARRTNETGPGIHANLQPLLPRQKTWKVGLLLGAFLGALAILLFISPHARAQEAIPVPLRPTRSSRRTASRGARRASGTSRGRATRASRASPPTSASIRARPSSSRSRPTPPTTASTSTAWATTVGTGPARSTTIQPSATLPQNQPNCLNDSTTGLIDCGNWDVSASWDVPADAVSGIYFAKLVREDVQNSGGSHIRLHRARRRRQLGSALPDLRHHLAGLQPVRRQQPLHGINRPAAPTRSATTARSPRVAPAKRTGSSTPSTRW